MSSKTKIVVLRMKEVIYTGIFIGLALLLLILCFIMFRPAKKEASTSSSNAVGIRFDKNEMLMLWFVAVLV